MKLKIFLFAFLIFFLNITLGNSLVNSLEDPFKLNIDCVNIIQNEDSSTYQNLTFVLTPSIVDIINKNMDKTGYSYNYTYCKLNETGFYTANGCSNLGCWSYPFYVTINGDNFDTSQSITYVILLVITLILLTAFIILSIKIPYENEKQTKENGDILITKVTKTKYVKLVCIWFSYGLFLWFLTIITGLVNNYITFVPLQTMITNLYIFSYVLAYIISIFMIWFIFINIWKDIILNKTIIKEGSAIIHKL